MTDLSKRLENEPLLSSTNSSLNDQCPPPAYTLKNNNGHGVQQAYNSFPTIHDANGSVNNQEKEDAPKPEEYVTYKRKWYILIMFSLMAFTQSGTWNTWGPIADTAKAVLGWTDADIALLTNWGPITYVVSAPFFSWVMDVKGLKMSMLFATTLQMLGVALRCIPVPVQHLRWVMNAGHVFIGFAGPVLMAGPPLISAVWFPPHQRTTSTAFLAATAYLGIAASFFIGPLIVSDIHTLNSTEISPANGSILFADNNSMIIPGVRNHHIQEINLLMYIEAGWTLVLFIMTWVYFPAKPPTPPSASAETKREDFVAGARILFTSLQFWLPALCYSVSTGVLNCWFTQLDTIFENTLQVGQDTVGWIGFYSNIAGVVASLILARFIDHLGGKIKPVLLIMAFCGTACCIWIVLLCLQVISFNLASLYVSLIALAVIVNSTVPLYFEVTVEGTYPVAEGLTAMIMTWMNNFYGLLFLLILMIHSIGVQWMNYVALGAVAVCIPMLLGYKERYNRLTQDTAVKDGEEQYRESHTDIDKRT